MLNVSSLLLAAALARSASAAVPATLPLERVRLGVRDLPGALAWLDSVLGWKPSYRDGHHALVTSGSVKLELTAADADSTVVLALTSDDVDADHKRLVERGAISLSAPTDRPSGSREALLKGPGGVVVELDGPLAQPPDFVFTELLTGTGETPQADATVKVRYVGSIKDGPTFDETHRTGRPALIPLGSANRCWPQALTRMKVGGRARFVCPPELAYGKKGRPPRIPPNATLIFEVELVGISR